VVSYVAMHHRLGALWNVLVIDGDRAPLAFQVDDAGEALLVDTDDGRCELLAATWEWLPELGRAPGSYFVARQYRYQGGELVAGAQPQVLTHRRDAGYDPRRADDDGLMQAVATFDHPHAALRDDPALALDVVETRTARVIAVEAEESEDEAGLVLELSFSGLPPVRYRTLAALDLEDDDDVPFYSGIGWRGEAHLLPTRYVPSDPSAWIGREVTVETRANAACCSEGVDLVRYLWIDPQRDPVLELGR
jgi:hypothetical protein